jgi:PAS domain S-box-containing protein
MRDNYQNPSSTKEDGGSKQAGLDHEISRQQIKDLLEDDPIAVYTCDQTGCITFYNQSAVKLWGFVPETGDNLWHRHWKMYQLTGETMAMADSPMGKALREERIIQGQEITVETPGQVFKRLLVYCRPVYDAQHTLIGSYNSLVDISDKIFIESKQAVLSAIVESSDDAIISKNLESTIISWNRGAERIFGYKEEEVLGKSIKILIPPSRLTEEDEILRQIRSGKKVDHFETIRVAKSGMEIPISITVSPVKDNYGNIVGASKIARDISEQVKAQKEIERNAKNLELLNSIGKLILGNLDANSLLQQVTDATTKITGAAFGAFLYNTTNVDGDPFLLYTLSGLSESVFEQMGVSKQVDAFNQGFEGRKAIRMDDLTTDPMYKVFDPGVDLDLPDLQIRSYLAVPVVSSSGHVVGALLFGHPEPAVFKAEHEDIIGSIAAQAAIALENSRLFEEVKGLNAKKDEFIALASHELKTPLTTIKGYLQLVSTKAQDKIAKMFIDKSLYQVGKLNSLISDLLDVSKIEAGKLQFNSETLDMRALVAEVMETFPYTNNTHKILFDLPEEKSLIVGDRQRIEQVLINLLTNAIKYSPKADKVYVSINNDKERVTVRIKDEGVGLKEEHLNKIFNRFYRAEGVGHVSGLGIGLYLTKEIIERHHGEIHVTSEYGKGSEFFFSLPLEQSN